MADEGDPARMPSLEDMQHWTGVIGRAQQMMLAHATKLAGDPPAMPDMSRLFQGWGAPLSLDTDKIAAAQADFWRESMALWQRVLDPGARDAAPETDRRFADPAWRDHPAYALIRETYGLLSDALARQADAVEGLTDRQREQLRFATRAFVEAASPSNFTLTNPKAMARIVETRGESFLKGLENLLADLGRGQLTHTPEGAFEVGRDFASTPGQVVFETPLFQLIQYAPATDRVAATPLVIFPPWINRFYILDLGPKKSFVKWAVEQGLTVFMVSWKSADASLAATTLDDYVGAQVQAIDTVRDLLGVPAVHTIGYCVAGTMLAATLSVLAARGEAAKVASATFFTAQVDFSGAGELGLLADDATIGLLDALTAESGFLDGRYMAATFNLLRGRDLIWNYVVDNYLLGQDHRPFDLLHWNGDTTNLPAEWHKAYLRDFYRDNLLVRPGAIRVMGEGVDLTRVATPAYVQAGREDHIAPAESVWKITEHFRGPLRFVLAGSGHIAGVVNPPSAGRYQYWTSEEPAASLDAFVRQAQETAGSWWPDWRAWIAAQGDGAEVAADGARVPGGGSLPAIEPAPGRYVTQR